MNQISIGIIGNIFCSCSKWTTSQWCRGSCWSLRDWCCWRGRMFLCVVIFVEQNGVFCWTSSQNPVVKFCWWKGSMNAWWKKASTYCSSFFSKIQHRPDQQTFVSISCATTLESTLSLISCVPWWLGVTGARARWLFKNCCLWYNSKLHAARGISWESIVISWTRSFTFTVTESGPKSRDHSIPSLETENHVALM